jgi:hypothetical protein
MGYELHIVRRTDWEDDEEESAITLDEWLEYIKTDPELELTNGYEDIFNNWQDDPGYCLWLAHPQSDVAVIPWLSYCRGSIDTKYPDNDTIKKMIGISVKLNARVQGDDGEYYDNSYFDEKVIIVDDDKNEQKANYEKPDNPKRSWWKFW